MKAADVINGKSRWSIEQSDCLPWLRSLPDDSVDLVLTSPPYELARTYLEGGKNLGIARKTDAWVAWLVEVIGECVRVCRGLVAFVVEGQTRGFKWSSGPVLLMADLHRAGFNLRKPPMFSRIGIPGSGGPDWLRNDYEFIVCVSRPGKLPWSDNTAMGHPPKWAPGGEMSSRLANGRRVNQLGSGIDKGGPTSSADGNCKTNTKKPSHILMTDPVDGGLFDGGTPGEKQHRDKFGMASGNCRRPDGTRQATGRKKGIGRASSGIRDGDTETQTAYDPPVKANPGNIIHCLVGGGVMGNPLCHENEAPYPESLCEFFIRSFCPEDGIVCDPFNGSGTTVAVSHRWGRRGIGCDLRESQVELARRRVKEEDGMF